MSAGLQLKAHADDPPPGDDSEDAADVEPTLDKADIESTLTPRRLFPQNYNRQVKLHSGPAPQCEAQTPESDSCESEDGGADLCQDDAEGNPRDVTLNEFMVPHPNEHRFWPGAFVELDTLDKYMPTLVPPAEHARPPFFVGITSSAVGAEACLASAHPRYVRRCISKLLEAAGDTTPAKLDIRITEASTSEEAAASLGFSLEGAVGSIEAMFDTSHQKNTNVYFALLQQEMYSVYVDTPSGGSCHLSSEAPETQVAKGHENYGYISEITYGRMALLRVETSMTKSQLSAQLAAKSDYWAVKLDANGKVAQNGEHKDMETTWLIRGGSIHQAAQAVQSGNFNELLKLKSATGDSISSTAGAVPISYTVRTLADDKPVSVKLHPGKLLDAGVRELLEDGGFESGESWSDPGVPIAAGTKIKGGASFAALDGTGAYKIWSNVENGWDAYSIKLTELTPGATINFSVAAWTHPEDSFKDPSKAMIELRFSPPEWGVDSGGGTIQYRERGTTAQLVYPDETHKVWRRRGVSATVPEDTHSGCASIVIHHGKQPGGAVFIDGMSVTTTGTTGRAEFADSCL